MGVVVQDGARVAANPGDDAELEMWCWKKFCEWYWNNCFVYTRQDDKTDFMMKLNERSGSCGE